MTFYFTELLLQDQKSHFWCWYSNPINPTKSTQLWKYELDSCDLDIINKLSNIPHPLLLTPGPDEPAVQPSLHTAVMLTQIKECYQTIRYQKKTNIRVKSWFISEYVCLGVTATNCAILTCYFSDWGYILCRFLKAINICTISCWIDLTGKTFVTATTWILEDVHISRVYAKALQREEGWSSPVHNADQLFKPLFSFLSFSFTRICISAFQDRQFKMSFKFLCSPCTNRNEKMRKWQLLPNNLWSISPQPQLSYHKQEAQQIIQTLAPPVGFCFLSSQERFKQGWQICTTRDYF